MWHGAYDPVQGRKLLMPRLGAHWLSVFLAAYAGLVVITLLGWWLLPSISLALFLTYSAWHFGTEPEHRTPGPIAALAAFALGAVPIVAACRWHAGAVTPIFTQMLGGKADPHAAALTHGLAAACWPVLVIALAGTWLGQFGRGSIQRAGTAAVIVVTAALFALCDPLVAFAVYFCCWHTPEHLVSTSEPAAGIPTPAASVRRNLRAGFLPWLVSLVFLGAMFYFGRHTAASYGPEMFILLSALTVPHMALNELGRVQAARSTAAAVWNAKGAPLDLHRA